MHQPATPTTDTSPPQSRIDDDDQPVGRFLSRREILALFGLSGVAVAAAACAPGSGASPSAGAGAGASASASAAGSTATPSASVDPTLTPGATATTVTDGIPSCVVVPELTEGPFYVDTGLERADIRVDTTTGAPSEGVVLTLAWIVSMVDGTACVPIEGAVVDVWHCDAAGVYSGVSGNGGDFLRGVQRTDAEGRATFTTIYPGWYRGRAVHIHFKVRTDPDASSGFELTSQLFLPDELSSSVFASAPYQGDPDMTNEADGIFGRSDGTTLLDASASDEGYAATFSIALQLT